MDHFVAMGGHFAIRPSDGSHYCSPVVRKPHKEFILKFVSKVITKEWPVYSLLSHT